MEYSAFKWCLCLFLCLTSMACFAAPADTTSNNTGRIDSLPKKKLDTGKAKTDTAGVAAKANSGAVAKKDSVAVQDCGCVPVPHEVGGIDWLLIFLPALVFLGLLIVLLTTALKDFKFKDAMAENEYPTVVVDNPLYNQSIIGAPGVLAQQNLGDTIPPTIERTYINTTTNAPESPHPSISRYIAFVSSVLTLVVALGVACFYIYYYIRTSCPPDLSGISTLLIALGIGVLPYAFNKVSTAIGKNKDE